ncbi:hypothetical protein J5N97_022636 [Dioscorea zingiberensis]|uniref:Uncharacterized protein n=1 Tax=Dioscorea zingiberensis TaxID=325984 RepID=A0A9D5CBA8_9LILI|nr:hypothetical protein J5N97_022636 [Dioscorea zingiberensis]
MSGLRGAHEEVTEVKPSDRARGVQDRRSAAAGGGAPASSGEVRAARHNPPDQPPPRAPPARCAVRAAHGHRAALLEATPYSLYNLHTIPPLAASGVQRVSETPLFLRKWG